MQKKIVNRGPLLNEYGELNEVGYSNELIKDYSRKDIKANSLRIKEWDYFLVYNEDFGLCFALNAYSPIFILHIIIKTIILYT